MMLREYCVSSPVIHNQIHTYKCCAESVRSKRLVVVVVQPLELHVPSQRDESVKRGKHQICSPLQVLGHTLTHQPSVLSIAALKHFLTLIEMLFSLSV